MALKSTVFKLELQVADLDRNYYGTHQLTLARHPSETDERMMLRVLAFALYAEETLQFGRGISTEDEPDLWQKDYTDVIQRWIDLGQPDERDIRKACGRASHVVQLIYGGAVADVWWDKQKSKLERLQNLTVLNIVPAESAALAVMAERNMRLQATIQDGTVLMTAENAVVEVHPLRLKEILAETY